MRPPHYTPERWTSLVELPCGRLGADTRFLEPPEITWERGVVFGDLAVQPGGPLQIVLPHLNPPRLQIYDWVSPVSDLGGPVIAARSPEGSPPPPRGGGRIWLDPSLVSLAR